MNAVPNNSTAQEGTAPEARGKRARTIALCALAAALAAATVLAWQAMQPRGDTGSSIIPMGTMTHEEAVAMLDEQVERSRITVSLQPTPKLADGRLHINFIVDPDNNGFAERVEIEQEGTTVYRSGVVQPGKRIEWCDAPQARTGPATATVYAVDDEGNDHGNPVSVEIELVEGGPSPTARGD